MPYKQRKRLWGIFQVWWESIGGFWPRGLQNSINILKRLTQLWDREELSGAIAVIQVRDNGALDQNHRSRDGRKWTDSQYILENLVSDCVYISHCPHLSAYLSRKSYQINSFIWGYKHMLNFSEHFNFERKYWLDK